jgi:putative SOS response-associated peptidase YedK
MCSHYQGIKKREQFYKLFGFYPAHELGEPDVWPSYLSTFVKQTSAQSLQDERGRFGLVPHWASPEKPVRNTFNARSETVAEKPSFKHAWQRGQRCVVAAEVIYEPCWVEGRNHTVALTQSIGEPFLMAAIYETPSPKISHAPYSFSLLTVNADTHAVMKHLHRPTDEKRMVALLTQDEIEPWLLGTEKEVRALLRMYPAECITVTHLLAPVKATREVSGPVSSPATQAKKVSPPDKPQGRLF